MGEYAEAAIQNGIANEGCGNIQREDRAFWWTDVTGRTRPVEDMDSLHLCFVLNYQIAYGKTFPDADAYYHLMGVLLEARGWSVQKLETVLETFRSGAYRMYPDGDGQVETYYRKLLRKYPEYSWKPLQFYMRWK